MHRLKSLRSFLGRPGTVAPAFAPFPLRHSVGGGGNWDEILGIGAIVLFLVALAAFGFISGRQKKKKRSRDQRRSNRRS